MKSNGDTLNVERPVTVVGLGELIWDFLPEGKQLGGAPNNFAYVSRILGNNSVVASRVGADELGREARDRLERVGIVTDYLQLDESHPTGTVGVKVDERGEAHFSMNEDSAWDYLEWNAQWEGLSFHADVVGFGTMAQREPHARATILRFIENTRPEALRMFDINLRHAFFTADMLARSLELATIVKLNEDELDRVAGLLDLDSHRGEAFARKMMARFDLELVAITRGERGSVLISREGKVEHRGFKVKVQDTIGAGDAFAAALAHLYFRRAPLEMISEAANRMGSWVATQVGATPEVSDETLGGIFGELSPEL